MENYELLIDLYKKTPRQGPGGVIETKMALNLAMLDTSHQMKIADLGSGTGGSTLVLAKELDTQITAVDLSQTFLNVLQAKVQNQGLNDKISTLHCSFDTLPFSDSEFDVIWSEGAIYNIGFENGITKWKRFLKPEGILVVSEITWLTAERPSEIQSYWKKEYPEIGTPSSKMAILERHGYIPTGYFILPRHCWIENFYRPLKNTFNDFLQRNGQSESAKTLVKAHEKEIALYENFNTYYSYGFYIAKKLKG